MTDYNGAYTTYADSSDSKIFFRNEDICTKTATIKTGQVLKALSFLQSDADGKLIAHQGVVEKALVTFADIAAGKTVILGGLTFTAGGSGALKADLVSAFSGLAVGITAANANIQNPVSGGTFTSGTLAGYNVYDSSTANAVVFVSTTENAGVTDLADTGNGSGTTIVVTSVADPQKKIAGVTVFDVDATSADVDTTVYTEASFWADALVWYVDPATDTITKEDGTTVACTDYNTGVAGTTADKILVQKKFVEGSEFEQLGYISAGEQY